MRYKAQLQHRNKINRLIFQLNYLMSTRKLGENQIIQVEPKQRAWAQSRKRTQLSQLIQGLQVQLKSKTKLPLTKQSIIQLMKFRQVSCNTHQQREQLKQLKQMLSTVEKLLKQEKQEKKNQAKGFVKLTSSFTDSDQFNSESTNQLAFFINVGWVFNLVLASRDNSVCLDQDISGLAFTFRGWLWVSFALGLAIVAMLLLIVLLLPCLETKFMLFLSCLFPLTLIVKFIWIFIGMGVYLNDLNFSDCSENVITLCSLQFVTYFCLTVYLVLNKIKQIIAQKCASGQNHRIHENSFDKKDQKSKNSMQQLYESIMADENFKKRYEHLTNIKKQLVFWVLVGWVYAFVIAKKDGSICLDQTFKGLQITYRQWFWGDGGSTLVLFLCFIILLISLLISKQKLSLWQNEDLIGMKFQWVSRHKVLSGIFLLSLFFKIVWIFLGMGMFFNNLTIQNCSSNIVNYLIVYFVWAVYILITFLTTVLAARSTKSLFQTDNKKK